MAAQDNVEQESTAAEAVTNGYTESANGQPSCSNDDRDGLKLEPMDVGPVTVKNEPGSSQSLQNGDSVDSNMADNEDAENDEEDEDEKPLAARLRVKRDPDASVKTESVSGVKRKLEDDDDEDETSLLERAKKLKVEDEVERKEKKHKKEKKKKKDKHKKHHKKDKDGDKSKKHEKSSASTPSSSPSKKKKEEEPVWQWWKEIDATDNSVKWKSLEHNGPCFAPDYEPLPANVRFYYDGKAMKLSPGPEEAATFYCRLIEHEYTSKDIFNNNFMKDWKKLMTSEEKAVITDIKKCNFKELNEYFKQCSEERKAMSKEQKQKIKLENEALIEKFGWAIVDGYKQRIGNFKIEPPGIFRGRGDHPKQGKLKKRVMPEDVTINCSKGIKYPEPPPGHKWKEIRHDNTVGWLASWTENIASQNKYIMLNATSKIKGQKDYEKYEKARELHKHVDRIREKMREDWKSKEMKIRQRSVALYFIDRLALRAGNEKDESEVADTVGCCSLRVEHIKLHEKKGDKEFVVDFDFLGKDSIRYVNSVPVEKRVFKNLQLFMENKEPADDLFDRLNTSILNSYLSSLMDGLTAKVFRTYNASITLQEQLDKLTESDTSEHEKVLSYNRANREVAILCNHQRAVSKNFDEQMEKLIAKISDKKKEVKLAKKERDAAKTDIKHHNTIKNKTEYERKKKRYDALKNQLTALEIKATDKDENKEIALSTSKLNYLDPRITVQWCLTNKVPLTKVYSKTHRAKFQWAIDMVTTMNDEGEAFDFRPSES